MTIFFKNNYLIKSGSRSKILKWKLTEDFCSTVTVYGAQQSYCYSKEKPPFSVLAALISLLENNAHPSWIHLSTLSLSFPVFPSLHILEPADTSGRKLEC